MKCAMCDASLDARPVLTEIKPTSATRSTYLKRVVKKPAQVVLALRLEGSIGLTPELHAAVGRWGMRVCASCAGEKGERILEVLAVALDKMIDRKSVV